MLSTFLEKASGLLSRRFLVVYWFPTFIAAVLALLPRVWVYGIGASWRWWVGWGPSKDYTGEGSVQIWLLVGSLLMVTLVAYILQAFTRLLVQFYEGYRLPQGLERRMVARVAQRWAQLRQDRREAAKRNDLRAYNHLQDRLYYEYPDGAAWLLPTRLGNVLRSAERFSSWAYGMDAPFWWPRLWPLLPEKMQETINDALASMLALLNFATLIVCVAIDGTIYLAACWAPNNGLWAVAALAVGLLIAAVSYQGAVAQARSYGQQIRAAVDLHRFDVLKTMHHPLPKTPQEERALWAQLSQWLYNQDRGAAQALVYAHGKKEQSEGQAKNAAGASKAKSGGMAAFLNRFVRNKIS